MIKIVHGDILNAKENIIGHQVNCIGVMGAGLAKQIKNKYPVVYTEYKKLCDKTKNKKDLMGKIQGVNVTDEPFGKIIINIFSQYSYGRNERQTDYESLKSGLEQIHALVTLSKQHYHASVALPYGIGAGLAGGDWNIIYKIIDDVFDDYEVTLYKLK